MKKAIVVKIGGSLLKDPTSYLRAAEFIAEVVEKGYNPIVVVSAAKGVTDEIIKAFEEGIERFKRVIEYYSDLAHSLGGEKLVREIYVLARRPLKILEKGVLDEAMRDLLLAFGEKASKIIFVNALQTLIKNVAGVSSEDFIITNCSHGNAHIDFESTRPRIQWLIKNAVENNFIPVIEGFTGMDEKGHITTLGRGGSDYTATAIAALGGVEEVWLITEVKGVYTADPSMGVNPRIVKTMSYNEGDEAARHGVKRFNEKTFHPLKAYPGPVVRVGSYESLGTTITREINREDMKPKIIHSNYSISDSYIAIIGEIVERGALLKKIIELLESENIEIKGVEMHVNRPSILVYISKDNIPKSIKIIHKELIDRGAL
ncbi:amino acid kinase family protein [Thermogladius sp. 4427co]|uniref:amino acid kinase family protein n=1 Tax=Thermogladius sp. 4427co TaxID=3450718 RepID=UPI003F7B1CD2